ncbi:MAG: DNA gyrase C-terminal beta-propeller domain-containing protein [Pseudomonadota bacterium]
MARTRKPKSTLFPNAPEVEKKLRIGTALDERLLALLEELALIVRELPPEELLERPFHTAHGDLYFRIRSAFGSYYRALATLARMLTSPRLEAEDALDGLRDHYKSGAALDEAHFLLTDPMLGRALLQHHGSVAAALEAAGIDASMARQRRRLDDGALLERATHLLGRSEGRTAREWEVQDPLLMEAARHRFDRVSDFFGWLDAQMADRSVIQAVREKREAVRLLAAAVPVVGRGGKGRVLPGKRYEVATCSPGGRNIYLLTASGSMFRLRPDQMPLDPTDGTRLPLDRSDRIVSIFPEPAGDEHVAIATDLGRIKLIPAGKFRSFLSDGVRAAALEEGDTCAAACRVNPDSGDLVVITRAGSGLRVDPGELRASSRHSRGVLRVRPKGPKDGVAALFQALPDGDYAVLTRDGRVRRGPIKELPIPLSRAAGVVAARGEVAGAASVDALCLGVMTRNGRVLVFEAASVRTTSRYAKGVTAIRMERGDKAVALFPVP